MYLLSFLRSFLYRFFNKKNYYELEKFYDRKNFAKKYNKPKKKLLKDTLNKKR